MFVDIIFVTYSLIRNEVVQLISSNYLQVKLECRPTKYPTTTNFLYIIVIVLVLKQNQLPQSLSEPSEH